MIEFKLNGKLLSIPTAWEELTCGQYLQIMELGDDYLKAVSILSGLDYEILKTAKIEGLESIIAATSFMNKVPDFGGTCDSVGGHTLPKNDKGQFNIQFESLAQFEDMRAVIKTCSDAKSIAHAFPKFVAIYLQKIRDTDYSYSKAIEMVPEVMAMPAKEVIITGSFFLRKAEELIEWHSKNLPPYNPEPEEEEAGFGRIAQKFGAALTISRMARAYNTVPDTIYNWPARVFYYEHIMLAWEAHTQSEYNRLLMKRK